MLLSWLEIGVLVGLLYAPVTIGLVWAFRVMNYPDLTCEGTFMVSAAVSIAVLNATGSIALAAILAIMASAVAGSVTGCLRVYLRVSPLLSGIITWAILYSLTIRILGGVSNVPATRPTLFSLPGWQGWTSELGMAFFGALAVWAAIVAIGASRWGQAVRAFGDQPWFSVGLGYSSNALTISGLAIANAMIGFGGFMLANFRQVADVNLSAGTLVSGLAALVIGEAIFASRRFIYYAAAAVAGTIVYNLAIGAFYFDWFPGMEKVFLPSDVRMVSGFMLLVPAALMARQKGRYKLFASEW